MESLWQVHDEVLRTCCQYNVSNRNDGHQLSLRLKAVIDQDLLQMLGQLWYPRHYVFLYRVGQVGDKPAGHATSHLIAVLHLKSTHQILNELTNVRCNSLIHSAYESMQNEQTSIHHFAELVEDIDCQVDKHAEHLIIDCFVTDADYAWL